MNGLRDIVAMVNGKVNNFVWGLPMLVLLVGTGILMTVLTKGFQLSHFRFWMAHTVLPRRTGLSASSRAFAPLWPPPSVQATSQALLRPLLQAVPGPFSGCGSWPFSA